MSAQEQPVLNPHLLSISTGPGIDGVKGTCSCGKSAVGATRAEMERELVKLHAPPPPARRRNG